MAKKVVSRKSWLQANAVRVTRVHFLYLGLYFAATVVFDTWNLYTHEAIVWRWTAAGILLALNTILWYAARIKYKNDSVYLAFVLLLIVADIIFAALNVYWERGIASKSVVLFVVPLLTAATLRSRVTMLAAAALSATAYSVGMVRYFFQHYGEGYRIELWGTAFLYSAMFFVFVWLLLIISHPEDKY